MSDTDYRKSPRVELSVEIDVNTDTNFYTGFTENISNGGIFVATHTPAKVGEEVPLSFKLPNTNHVIKTKGTVQWNRDFNKVYPDTHPGMGLKFISLSKEDEHIINEYIRNVREPYFHPSEDEF